MRDTTYKEWIKRNENKWIVAGITAIIFGISMPIMIYSISSNKSLITLLGELGPVGDFLGGTTVGLFSLASMLFLVSTIIMQKSELNMQREELKLTREELAKANKQYEITNETMLKQQCETTLFNMISMQNVLIEGLTLKNGTVRGREVFVELNNAILKIYKDDVFELFLDDYLKHRKENLSNFITEYRQLLELENKTLSEREALDLEKKIKVHLETGEYYDTFGQHHPISWLLMSYDEMQTIPENQGNDFRSNFSSQFLKTHFYKRISYLNIVEANNFMLNNYFSSVISVTRFINNSNLNEDEKSEYKLMYFSQFNMSEISLIMYEGFLNDNLSIKAFYHDYIQFNLNIGFKENLLEIGSEERRSLDY